MFTVFGSLLLIFEIMLVATSQLALAAVH